MFPVCQSILLFPSAKAVTIESFEDTTQLGYVHSAGDGHVEAFLNCKLGYVHGCIFLALEAADTTQLG